MTERLTFDISADLRAKGDPLSVEAADKLDGLLACLVEAEALRDEYRDRLAAAEQIRRRYRDISIENSRVLAAVRSQAGEYGAYPQGHPARMLADWLLDAVGRVEPCELERVADDVDLSPRSLMLLLRNGYTTVAQVLAASDEDLYALRNSGMRLVDEVRKKLSGAHAGEGAVS